MYVAAEDRQRSVLKKRHSVKYQLFSHPVPDRVCIDLCLCVSLRGRVCSHHLLCC